MLMRGYKLSESQWNKIKGFYLIKKGLQQGMKKP